MIIYIIKPSSHYFHLTRARCSNRSIPSVICNNCSTPTSWNDQSSISRLKNKWLTTVLLSRILEVDRLARRQESTGSPQRSLARIASSTQWVRVGNIPVTKVIRATNDVDVLTKVGRSVHVEIDIDLAGCGNVWSTSCRGGNVNTWSGSSRASSW